MVILFLIGIFIGSFLGVICDRIYRNETIIKGRSYCEYCKHTLGWYDLIPLFSFIFLKGKCRYCRKNLPLYYPLIELTTGIMFAITYAYLNFQSFSQFSILNFQIIFYFLTFIFYFAMVSSFIVIFFSDIKYGVIPDKILLSAIVINFLLLFTNSEPVIVNHILTAFGAFTFFVVVSVIFYTLTKKVGFGGGDIKLAFLLGLFLGFPLIIAAMYIAFLTGAIISIILILWRKKKFFKDSIPFGPFLITGSLISLFLGNLLTFQILPLLGL